MSKNPQNGKSKSFNIFIFFKLAFFFLRGLLSFMLAIALFAHLPAQSLVLSLLDC